MCMGAACAGLPQSRAGPGGHEANMEELGCVGIADVYGGCGNVWGLRLSIGGHPRVWGRKTHENQGQGGRACSCARVSGRIGMPTHIMLKWPDDVQDFTVSAIHNIKCDTSYRYIPNPILNKLGNSRKIRFSIRGVSRWQISGTRSQSPTFGWRCKLCV